jgi:hypothetical protein
MVIPTVCGDQGAAVEAGDHQPGNGSRAKGAHLISESKVLANGLTHGCIQSRPGT